MPLRSALSSVLTFVLMFTSVAALARDDVNRDAELMNALRIIAARDGGWTAKEWQTFGYTAAKYALAAAAVAGAGAALYYFRTPRGWARKSFEISTTGFTRTRDFLANHGGKVALGVAGPIVLNHIVNRLAAMNNISEAERLRSASTPDARVYRSHLRHFFKLSLSEQFLIARQDAVLTDDLIRLAQWITTGAAEGLNPR